MAMCLTDVAKAQLYDGEEGFHLYLSADAYTKGNLDKTGYVFHFDGRRACTNTEFFIKSTLKKDSEHYEKWASKAEYNMTFVKEENGVSIYRHSQYINGVQFVNLWHFSNDFQRCTKYSETHFPSHVSTTVTEYVQIDKTEFLPRGYNKAKSNVLYE